MKLVMSGYVLCYNNGKVLIILKYTILLEIRYVCIPIKLVMSSYVLCYNNGKILIICFNIYHGWENISS